MSTKIPNLAENFPLINATFWTAPLNVSAMDVIGYTARIVATAGALNGTWAAQASNDFVDKVDNPLVDTKWQTITPTSGAIPATAAADINWLASFVDYPYKLLRLKFTFTSGTGSMVLFSQMKGR